MSLCAERRGGSGRPGGGTLGRASPLLAGRWERCTTCAHPSRHGRARRFRAHPRLQRSETGRRSRRRWRPPMGPGGRLDGHAPKGQEAPKERGAGPGPHPRQNPHSALPSNPSPLQGRVIEFARDPRGRGPVCTLLTASSIIFVCFNELNYCSDTTAYPHRHS